MSGINAESERFGATSESINVTVAQCRSHGRNGTNRRRSWNDGHFGEINASWIRALQQLGKQLRGTKKSSPP